MKSPNLSNKDKFEAAGKLLKIKNEKRPFENTDNNQSDDSSDEELLLRTGNVPRHWYDEYDHSGYDINANKVLKPPKEDEIESFLKKAENKNWWRNIYDEMNNKTIFISDKDLELIRRVRKNLFANKNASADDYFEQDVPKIISPLSTKLPWKRSFELSRHERKAINRIARAIKRGDIVLGEKKLEKENIYDIWAYENTDPNSKIYHPGRGYQAPKRELPDTEFSYNPPESYVNEENPDCKQIDALRKIPKYNKLLEENFERLCDLVMSSRFVKKKTNIKIEDILPTLPKPEELKPFPTKENILYRGHDSTVTAMICDPTGKFLISADNGGFIYFWDILTAKIIKRIDISDDVQSITYNTTLNLICICGKEKIFFMLPPFLEKKVKKEISNLIENKIKPLILEKNQEENDESNPVAEKEKKIYEWKIPKKDSQKERHGIAFYIKWKEGVIKNLTWHNKGDYFSVLANNSSGKAQIYIHSLSRLVHQKPFSKIKGVINSVCFHPNKPHFVVATNSNIFVYNLQKQVNIFY